MVSVGVPLGLYLTIIHVAEEIRDRDWPVPDFWKERAYVVREGGEDESHVVRQCRPEFGFCLCMRAVSRELVAEGIVHEGAVEGVRVDWAHSREVLDYCMTRNRSSRSSVGLLAAPGSGDSGLFAADDRAF